MIRALLCAVLALSACHAPPAHHGPRGTPVLRALWRDGTHRLLVAIPDKAHPLPPGDCTAPLLIDEASGTVRQISADEASVWMQHMQLSGAMTGSCP